MGTRNYAEAVAKIIDPDRKLFQNRILSRDESGSKFHFIHERICLSYYNKSNFPPQTS